MHDPTLTTAPTDEPVEDQALGALVLPARYHDLGRLAAGGFGEVRRVHDRELDRAVAMKLLRPDVAATEAIQARFLAETRLHAGLEHPGIVGVYDTGRLADGRLWFTMREVRGRTFREVIDELHEAAGPAGFRETASGWTFRRLVDAFARVGQAVAYAHRRGVVHRDLKPDNLMVGELGEALVMDWGLGRRVEAQDLEVKRATRDAEEQSAQLTRHGDVLGTPAYMPPEQAAGQRDRLGPRSDVYALGAVLYQLLSGHPPYRAGSAALVLTQVLAGPPPPVRDAATHPPIPEELAAICERAMARAMDDRYADAEALARDVVSFLDGARRREQALERVATARVIEPEIASLRARAATLRAEAQSLLDGARPFDPVERKEPGWAREDEAGRLEVAVALREAEWLQGLQSALTVDPDLAEAHEALADHHRDGLLAAERAHRDAEAARAEALLRAHDRGRFAGLLRGEGALTLVTEPPCARVDLYRYVDEKRRLWPRFVEEIGPTPIHAKTLPKGSYLCVIRAEGCASVHYPVLIERGAHWDGAAPGEATPSSLPLPREGELGPEDVYVPAGWCWIGGDGEAPDSLPLRRIWVDGFMIGRFPVTTGDYLAFVNDLVSTGREAEALAACPRRELGAVDSGEVLPVFLRGPDRSFALPPDWTPDLPMVMVDWHAASAHARWLAQRTGRPTRLPNELEWEKAARGVDGRALPWGNHPDPAFSCALESHHGPPRRMAVDSYPVDESPYGVRGLAGNVRDWCINGWKLGGPALIDERLQQDPASPEDPDFRSIRGGTWGSSMVNGRAAGRFGGRPARWTLAVGLRTAWSYPPR